MADFQIELPELAPIPAEQEELIEEQPPIDLSLMKINLSASLLIYLLKSILLKKRIVLISRDDFINSLIVGFLKSVTQGNFKFEVLFLSEEDFEKGSDEFTDAMIFDGPRIINNVDDLIKPKKMKVEKNIVHNFLSEADFNSSTIMFRNELQKAFLLSNSILEIVKKMNNLNKFNISKVAKDLEKKYNVKINNEYMEFLVDIVRNYYEINLPSAAESFFKLL
jgi:hypothetical protein